MADRALFGWHGLLFVSGAVDALAKCGGSAAAAMSLIARFENMQCGYECCSPGGAPSVGPLL